MIYGYAQGSSAFFAITNGGEAGIKVGFVQLISGQTTTYIVVTRPCLAVRSYEGAVLVEPSKAAPVAATSFA